MLYEVITTNTGFSESHIFRNGRIEMVTNHQHIEMFIYGIDGVRTCRVGRRWQHIGLPTGFDDIGRMATTRTFRVIGMNRAITNRCQRVFHKSTFIQGIGMDRNP